jgi:hypothetical protein
MNFCIGQLEFFVLSDFHRLNYICSTQVEEVLTRIQAPFELSAYSFWIILSHLAGISHLNLLSYAAETHFQ